MLRLCSVPGCGKTGHHRNPDLCHTHYCRLQKTGSVEAKPSRRKQELSHSGGYRVEYVGSHPLETPGRPHYVFQHRKVYYDTHGEGPFSCHVCGATLEWDRLHIDHLDDDPTNNALDNLAPSCPTCNQARGREKMIASRRAAGTQLTAFGRTRCLSEWAADIGISLASLARRLRAGWSVERAVSEPRGKFGPKPTNR